MSESDRDHQSNDLDELEQAKEFSRGATSSKPIEIEANIKMNDSNEAKDNFAAIQSSELIEANIKSKYKAGSPLSSTCCIYKVQRDIRSFNEMAYTPLLVSIGPFHRRQEKLMPAEEEKFMYLQSFIKRGNQMELKHYIEVVKDLEESARQSYSKPIKLESNEFVEMLLVDGVFILEFLIRHIDPNLVDKSDRIIWQGVRGIHIFKDMLLLENQIPFFVLEGLYQLAGINLNKPLCALIFEVFGVFSSVTNLSCLNETIWERVKYHKTLHLLDFLRACYMPTCLKNPRSQGDNHVEIIPPSSVRKLSQNHYEITESATHLEEAGVEFKVTKDDVNPLHINFRFGILEMPKLEIGHFSETIFRNLMAFEQYHYDGNTYIIDYIAFLDSLIDTPMDVDVLVRGNIMVNGLGSNQELSNMLNNITRNIVMEHHLFYYNSVCQEINQYARIPRNRWKATLRRDYFNSPWTIISLIAAIVLLILTTIQTIVSIHSW